MTTGFSGPFEDRLAVRELLDTYADAVTRRDAADWAQCWTEDAQWSLPDIAGLETVVGRDAIVALWSSAMEQFPGLVFRAWPGSIAVEGDRAVMRSFTSETFEAPGTATTVLGSYADLCLKREGIWRFSHREFRRLSPAI